MYTKEFFPGCFPDNFVAMLNEIDLPYEDLFLDDDDKADYLDFFGMSTNDENFIKEVFVNLDMTKSFAISVSFESTQLFSGSLETIYENETKCIYSDCKNKMYIPNTKINCKNIQQITA